MLGSATPSSPSPLRLLIDWFRRQREADELAHIDAGEAQRIAADLNISQDDLIHLARQSTDDSELMTRMMTLHGLDRAMIEADLPGLIRQMAVTCAHCASKGTCSHDLDHGASAEKADGYCPNSDTMNALAGR